MEADHEQIAELRRKAEILRRMAAMISMAKDRIWLLETARHCDFEAEELELSLPDRAA